MFDCPAAVYKGHTYLFCQMEMVWGDALKHCQGNGGHLVSVADAGEDAFVFDGANQFSNAKFWMGLNDIAVEGKFVWQDGSPVTYTHWEPMEPNEQGDEDCMQGNRFHPKSTWNDESCQQAYRFVCEIE
jgi:mannose receptor, C type